MTWSGASSGEHFVASNPVPKTVVTNGVEAWAIGNWINGIAWAATIYGMDAANSRLFLRDGSGPGFGQSDNWGVTNLNGMGIPANTSNGDISGVVAFGGFIYAIYKDLTSGQFGVYRAAALSAGSALTWSGQLLTLPAGVTSMAVYDNIAAGTSALMVAEYGDPVGGPSLWRSTNGTVWTKVYGPIAGTRHAHAIAEDPYNPGTWYATFGDSNAISMARSTDNGVTWSVILASTAKFQGVQLSFSKNWIWVANDRIGASVWVLDRATLTPKMASMNSHMLISVLDGAAARTVTDAVTTSGSGTMTSATAAFTAADKGKSLSPTAQIAPGSFISAFTNATTVTIAPVATGTASGIQTTIGGDRWNYQVLWGAVDPATEIFYFVSADGSGGGNRVGLFYLPAVGGEIQLLEQTNFDSRGGLGGPMFIGGGKLFVASYVRPLLTTAQV